MDEAWAWVEVGRRWQKWCLCRLDCVEWGFVFMFVCELGVNAHSGIFCVYFSTTTSHESRARCHKYKSVAATEQKRVTAGRLRQLVRD